MQTLGPRHRVKHLDVQTLWVQQLVKIDLASLNNVDMLENVADVLTKYVSRAVLHKFAEMMGYTFPGEEKLQSLKRIRVSVRIIGIRDRQ